MGLVSFQFTVKHLRCGYYILLYLDVVYSPLCTLGATELMGAF